MRELFSLNTLNIKLEAILRTGSDKKLTRKKRKIVPGGRFSTCRARIPGDLSKFVIAKSRADPTSIPAAISHRLGVFPLLVALIVVILQKLTKVE